MFVKAARRPPMAARPTPTQNVGQAATTIDRPPATNPAMMKVTATQETARPWNASCSPVGPGWASAPAGEPPEATDSGGAPPIVPGSTWFGMRPAPLMPVGDVPNHCGQARVQVLNRPLRSQSWLLRDPPVTVLCGRITLVGSA